MDAIERLKQERQHLAERLAEIDHILSKYEEINRLAERLFSQLATEQQNTDSLSFRREALLGFERKAHGVVEKRQPESGPQNAPKTPMEEFEKVVLQILDEADRPLDRVALYDELQNRKVVIGSVDKGADLNTLSARMSRMKGVTNLKGFGYWLESRTYADADYQPIEGISAKAEQSLSRLFE